MENMELDCKWWVDDEGEENADCSMKMMDMPEDNEDEGRQRREFEDMPGDKFILEMGETKIVIIN